MQQIQDNPTLIVELFHALRKRMGPEAKFQLEYDKQERILKLIEAISERYDIDIHRAEAKIITGN